jgi:hypothetical protein
MKHVINNIEVEIHWEQLELEENHGSGCKEYSMIGTDDNGNEYSAIGHYQDDELIEIEDVQME